MFRRIFFLVLTNIAIIVMGTVILWCIQRFFGIDVVGRLGTSPLSLIVFALIYGFLGSFVSLLLSRWTAKRLYHITLIDPQNLSIVSEEARRVFQIVDSIAQMHHISLPEVGIYESPEVNAFATGATRNSSLVAVSSGLLHEMASDELEGVIAHEMAHILNGDMVTMTLLQGVINAFVIFLSRALAHIISLATKRDEQ